MLKVRFIENWDLNLEELLMAHTPKGKKQWGDVVFTTEPILDADYIIVLNNPPRDMTVNISPERLWCGIGEPDIAHYKHLHHKRDEYSRIYGCNEILAEKSANYILSIPVLDRWKINRSYDFLSNSNNLPEKTRNLSWITSNKGRRKRRKGLSYRLNFLNRLMNSNIRFDLYGRGFRYIEDKWDAIAPYRYTIAFENHIGNHYWTEKLADILVCETMPIYVGCKKIEQYLPSNCMVRINPEDKHVFERINEVIHSDLREKHSAAIKTAKELVMNKYNMLYFFANEINRHTREVPPSKKRDIHIKKVSSRYPYWVYDEAVWRWPYCMARNIKSILTPTEKS